MTRLTAEFWVHAYLARLRFQDIPAYVVAHGDDTAGAVLVNVEYDWPEGVWERSLHVLLYELQRDMNAYLATLPGDDMPKTLADIVARRRVCGGHVLEPVVVQGTHWRPSSPSRTRFCTSS